MGAPFSSVPGEGALPIDSRRLTPAMSSRKLQALDFIKRYFAQWSCSPTLGELSAALNVSRQRAHDLVHQLAVSEMIEHTAGKARGIRLIDKGEELSEADILLKLSSRGWTIGVGEHVLQPPIEGDDLQDDVSATLVRALTEKGLHALPLLDHVEPRSEVAGTNGESEGAE